MKRKMKPIVGCTVSALTIAMMTSIGAMAATTNDANWAYKAVADVTTQVNIRAYASTESAIVGYLPKAASAKVVEKGQEWTHIISNGVEGYIKNEYLAYGDDAKALASVYGTPGVEIAWDTVRVFSQADSCSSIVAEPQMGKEYEVISDEGLWYSIVTSDGNVAYVPAEDVQKTIILDKAIAVEQPATYTATDAASTTAAADTTSANNAAADSTYTAPTESSTADSSYTENTYAENAYTEETEAAADTTTETTAPAESTATEETVTAASSSDLSLLAAIIYCEAGNQSREGKVAVGAVVMNRIASSSYPNTISEVIYQSGQFSPAGSGWLGQVLASGAPADCVEAAQAALNGENPVPGALYFNTSAGRGTKIGAHWFY